MIDQREILWGVLAPPVLMAVGMVATAAMPAARRVLSTGALLAVVFGISQLGFRGWRLPGADVQDWPAWIAFAAALLTLCSACGHGPLVWRILVRGALTSVATWLLLRPQLASANTPEVIAWIAGSGIVWTLMILVWERVHAATSPGASMTGLTVLAGLSSAALLLFNCMTHAQFAGILAAALAAALVIGWRKPGWYSPAGPVTIVAVVLPTLWLLGYRYAELPVWSLPFLALGGLVPLLLSIGPIRSSSDWKRIAAVAVATSVVVSPVLIWGVITSIKAASEPSYGY